MADPTTFAPLVTDFERDEDDRHPGGHYWFPFPNGYTLSVLRVQGGERKTLGYDDGLWEAVLLRKSPMSVLFGQAQYGLPVFNTPLTPDEDGAVAGNLDNAAVNALLAKVSALPAGEEVK